MLIRPFRFRQAAAGVLAVVLLAAAPSPAPTPLTSSIPATAAVPVATPLASAAPLPTAPPATNVTRATLRNGLRVVIVRDPLAPVTTEIMNYLVGGQNTPQGFPGTAHAVEHMVAGRSVAGLSSAQMNDITTLLGGDFNADTQQSVTQYYLTVPAQFLDAALRIEAARMTDSVVAPGEWSQERGAIEQEVSSDESSAFQRFNEKALAKVFAGTPYEHDPLGTRRSFDKTTGSDLRAFYKKWYAPNNAILVIAGDVDPQQALATVKTRFERIPSRPVPPQPAVRLTAYAPATIADRSDFPVPLGVLAFRMPGFRSPDYSAAEIAADVLSSQRGDLVALQAEGKLLGAGISYSPLPESGTAIAFAAVAPAENPQTGLDMVSATIAKYQKTGVPADLVEAAKQREVASALFSQNSIDGLAQDWSSALAVEGLGTPDERIAKLRAVTTDDVDRVVRTYLTPANAITGLLTPKPGAANTSGASTIHDVFGSKDAKPVALPAWTKELSAPASVPKSLVSPVVMTLDNGIRLIVQHESVSPTVTLEGRIFSSDELQTPPGREGVSSLLDGLFSYGTTTLDRLAFQKELDAIAADVSAGTSFSLNVPSQNVDRGVQLLADDLLHPALPPDAFAIVQRQAVQGVTGQRKSPDYLAGRALQAALVPPGDPTLREVTPQTLSAATLDDVRAYQATVQRPDLTTIVMAGDITPDTAKAIVTKYFGAWQAPGTGTRPQLPPIPLNRPSTHGVAAAGRTQTSVTLREVVAVRRTDPAYYALQLGDTILGGGFYATRLFRDLRANAGLVYTVSVGVAASKTRGTFDVSYGCDPAKVNQARGIVDRDLRDMGKRNVSPVELQRAKNQLARDLQLAESSVDAIAGGLAGRSEAELPLDQPTVTARKILALRADDVREAFAKYVDPSRFVQLNEGPALK